MSIASDFPRFVFNSGCAFITTCPPVLNSTKNSTTTNNPSHKTMSIISPLPPEKKLVKTSKNPKTSSSACKKQKKTKN